MKTKLLLKIRLDVEVESTRKVKAHTRVVNGKTVKVRTISDSDTHQIF